MPDFALAFAGNPIPLTTQYTAIVDGATGNTYLQSVHARLGSSPIDVQGEIAKTPGQKGTHITLDATSNDARLQDFLHLVVKGPPPLDGTISLRAKIDLPPTPEQKEKDRRQAPAPIHPPARRPIHPLSHRWTHPGSQPGRIKVESIRVESIP